MEDCLFCRFAKGEAPSEKVYEDESTLAFLDAHPSAPGHTLLIPKEHKETILDLDEDLIGKIFGNVKKITKQIEKALNPDGFNIGVNQLEIAGAHLPHLHIHIIPRFEGDKGVPIQTIVKNPPKETLAEIAEKIRSASDETEEKEKKKEEKPAEEKKEEEPEKKEKFTKEELEAHEKTWKRMKIPESKF